jgi:molybdopterin-guanine dinucleotide biosynthesis protein A
MVRTVSGTRAIPGTGTTAGLLLTGGRSRRMGTDKGLLQVGGRSLAQRTADLLAGVSDPALEVGPGWSGLAAVGDDPGCGPLTALVAGWDALGKMGVRLPLLVVATDLPRLSAALLAWLAAYPSAASIVPMAAGRPQMLCARYSPEAADIAGQLVAAGERSMRALLQVTPVELVDPAVWRSAGVAEGALTDVDTPEDLRRLRAWLREP